jgi:membrane-bound metal-dependent hydrolase YbcI (DUF457 family)
MDNLAHTLVGAALGRAVGDGRVPGAALLGAIAGNAPDWAELLVRPGPWWVTPRSGVAYLVYHRGITHSFLGAAVEIVGLSALVGLGLWWWARRRGAGPPSWQWIAACIAATVASHVYLDWQGSYGVRPFLPWSGQWYYADWVAIVDPFFWMVPLVALAWGARRHWAPALAFAVTLLGLAALMFWRGRNVVALWVWLAVAGLAAVCVIGWARHWCGVAGRQRAAAYAILMLAAYAGASGLAGWWAKASVAEAAIRRFGPQAQWAALPEIGRPFQWKPIWAGRDTVAGRGWAVPRHLTHPAVLEALATPEGRGIAQFARFLAADVDSGGEGVSVHLRDARYLPEGRRGWAAVEIRLR